MDCAIEFFRFLLKEKAEFLDLENIVSIQDVYFRKKKLLYDILYEIPIRNSSEKLFFLLEHKSRRANDFVLQIVKYKYILQKWQMKEFGKLSSIIPILFYQGLDNWDPEWELAEERKLSNPILSENRQEILNSLEEPKRIDLKEEMLDYIFRSRTEDNTFLEEAIMGRKVLTAYERAFEDGRGEGEFRNKLDTARKMSEEKFNREQILRITGLSELELRENGIS
jgi:hypothetical protein